MDNFHKIALQSILFKGRDDWYFCFLKSEKIAHVLLLLSRAARPGFEEIARAGSDIPKTICYFAAGEISPETLLADLFALQTSLRIAATENTISKENSLILVAEYEKIIEKIASQNQPSPFISAEDFTIPSIEKPRSDYLLGSSPDASDTGIKDTNKGHDVRIKDIKKDNKTQMDRSETILSIVRQNKGISIKDISALVRGCSEKTIQRELVSLIQQGLVTKIGERRWSLYIATPNPHN